MADQFDPYREALVLETDTVWPDDYDGWEFTRKSEISRRLHAEPDQASHLEYVRLHSGFCRRIYVTPEDLSRVE